MECKELEIKSYGEKQIIVFPSLSPEVAHIEGYSLWINWQEATKRNLSSSMSVQSMRYHNERILHIRFDYNKGYDADVYMCGAMMGDLSCKQLANRVWDITPFAPIDDEKLIEELAHYCKPLRDLKKLANVYTYPQSTVTFKKPPEFSL